MTMQQAVPVFAGADLLGAWQHLRQSQPGLRIRDGAALLNVSEAELVYASLGRGVQRLRSDWQTMLHGLKALGRVMALTRNESCVHERHGVYDNISIGGSGRIGLVVNGEIDLRFFMREWSSLFAVSEALQSGGMRRSLQIFDRQGVAVHKIYLTEQSNAAAWYDLCDGLSDDSLDPLTIAPLQADAELVDDVAVDEQALQRDWAELQDTHHFVAMLKRHSVDRLQALRLAGSRWAQRLPEAALTDTLEQVAASAQPIMVFVGNHGCIQIHSGSIKRVGRLGEWFNVLDTDFSLHLRESDLASVWRVRKPTADGIVSSLEAYDSSGELVIQLFGERKPGQPEQRLWRALLERHPAR
ncbi:hemin-degrading factor [Halopseudomonas maritima]|uniref:hemin-degrading factor n=1 Tax=Halopseudomonas maritima TaxID=2918528 RepID=UPI001EEA8C20|nr:ChuX/HutX family heme-like substrate-binding protein [Halopseudomonas maritima]UJJ30469.1 hemin-degrading factor [Halopseudomonas maritima]